MCIYTYHFFPSLLELLEDLVETVGDFVGDLVGNIRVFLLVLQSHKHTHAQLKCVYCITHTHIHTLSVYTHIRQGTHTPMHVCFQCGHTYTCITLRLYT